MIITLIISTAVFAILWAIKARASWCFHKQIKQLFSSSATSTKFFRHSQLEGLPPPVQRYFRHVLKQGQPYINFVRLRHGGKFKTGVGKKWVNILGEEYFTTNTPGFLWQGKTNTLTAKDYYIKGKGGLDVGIFDIYSVISGRGSKYNQGELLRWLGESVWFPTSLLPNEYLTWEPIDNSTAKLVFRYRGLQVYYKVSFNEMNEIAQLETRRNMGDSGLKTWIAKLSGYLNKNDVVIPHAIIAAWQLKQGTLYYADFKLTSIDYGIPKAFNNQVI